MAKKKSTRKKTAKKKSVATLTHDEAKRSNIPTAELETVMEDSEAYSIEVAIERRNPDLDPQLVWRGTRARDHLLISAVDPASEFLDDFCESRN